VRSRERRSGGWSREQREWVERREERRGEEGGGLRDVL
jgi:hypothetical protein